MTKTDADTRGISFQKKATRVACTWVDIVDHHSGTARDLQLEGPQVFLRVLPGEIDHGDAGQQQDLFLVRDSTQRRDVDPNSVDAGQNIRVGVSTNTH